MLKKIFFIHVVCFILLPLGIPSQGFACRCAGSISPAAAYRQADIVVMGKVLAVTGDINKEGATARISVSKAWKKPIPSEVVVSTTTTCAFDFQTGEEYLLYLREAADGNGYTSRKCVGNLPSCKAEKALDWLKKRGVSTGIEP